MRSSVLTQEHLKSLLSYDPETGEFRWTNAVSQKFRAGQIAGTSYANGYRVIDIQRKRYSAHDLAWLYVYGSWPANEIDHINRNPGDNRIENLREATRSQNLQNRALQRNNKSGFRGVSWSASSKKWIAQIKINNEKKHLGLFLKKEDAYAAYLAAAAKYHTHNPAIDANHAA